LHPAEPTITVDELGVGTIQFTGGLPAPLPGVLAPDPGPGGLTSALTYNLLGPPSLVAGDVILVEPGGVGLITDILRFNPAGTGGNPAYPASLVFYSDVFDGRNSLADTGFPTASYANTASFIETGLEGGMSGFLYTPTANQPGFVPGFTVTYNFVSDPAAVPEPASLIMAGTASVVGLGRWWRRRKGVVA
jgi:hypothetical protein